MSRKMTEAEFKDLQLNYFKEGAALERYDAVHERFETQVRNAIRLRDRARSGLSNEQISITLYGWMKKYLAVTKRYEYIEGIELKDKKGRIIVDFIEGELRFEESRED